MTTKGKTPKCKWCSEWVDKSLNDFEKTSGGYYHKECYEAFELQKTHLKELKDYISKIYKIEFPTGWMLKQIKEYKEKRNYTYKGMELTLKFMIENENMLLLDASKSGLGMIPYYYEKARKHYMGMNEIKDSLKDYTNNNISDIIYVETKKTKRKNNRIDIESII